MRNRTQNSGCNEQMKKVTLERYSRLCMGGAMAASSEEVLEAAVAGIPRVAQAIAEIPTEHRARPWGQQNAVTARLCRN